MKKTHKEMMNIPSTFEDLSADWLTYVLRNVKIISKAQVTQVKVVPLEIGKGFIGQIAKLDLLYSIEEYAPATMVVKLSPASVEMREIGREYGFFKREINFYRFIAPNISIHTPKCYYTEIDQTEEKFIILLEDLTSFENGDRKLGCSQDDALLVVTDLAKFHASWWEHEQLEKLEWLPDLKDFYEFESFPSTFLMAWKNFKNKQTSISPYVNEISARYSENVIRLSEHLFQDSPRTLIHFDFHLDNLIFHRDNRDNNKSQIVAIDWQLMTRGRGIVDFAFFLGQNLDILIRRRHEMELLDRYHQTLLKCGVKNYTFDMCLNDYKLALIFHLFGLVFSLGANSFSTEQDKFLIENIYPRNSAAVEDLSVGELLH